MENSNFTEIYSKLDKLKLDKITHNNVKLILSLIDSSILSLIKDNDLHRNSKDTLILSIRHKYVSASILINKYTYNYFIWDDCVDITLDKKDNIIIEETEINNNLIKSLNYCFHNYIVL